MSSDKKILFITGGNTGLGYEAVKALCQSGQPYEIIIGCRTVSKGEEAISSVKREVPSTSSTLSVVQVDITSDESIEKAVKTIESKFGHLDILVNNAGAAFDNKISSGEMSIRQAWNASWDLNVAGTYVMTNAAVPLLLKSSDPRLIFIASGTASMSETEATNSYARVNIINASPPAGWPKPTPPNAIESYRSSKAGLNMMMRQWHRLLLNDGVKVWAISPGFLATGLGGVGREQLSKIGALDPSVGGNFIKDVVEGKRDQDVGKVVRTTEIQPW